MLSARALVVLGLFLGAMAAAPAFAPASPFPVAYTAHAPIMIIGNAAFTAANGVVSGSGTPADPYIIAGWSINASGAVGIAVENTSAPFVIRGVDVHGGAIGGYAGIQFLNVANGILETSVLSNNSQGFLGEHATNIGIINSTFENDAIEISSSSVFSITDSNVSFLGSQWGNFGVKLLNVTQGTIARNTMWNVAAGVYAISYTGTSGSNLKTTTIDSNVIHTLQYGILANGSFDLKVVRNDFVATNLPNYYIGVAIWGTGSSGVVIAQNNITNFAYGFQFIDVPYTYLLGNNVSYSRLEAMDVPGSAAPAEIIGNTFWHNAMGFSGMFQGSLVYHNAFVNSTPMNARTGAVWDDGFPTGGNYWSDYAGVDGCTGPQQDVCTGPDGIGDTPFVIDANNTDPYPLMSQPGPLDYPPAAMFTISSSSPYAPATVTVDASASWDMETAPSGLEVRWDWNGDGVWDTGWTTAKTATHSYTIPGPNNGSYLLILEVRDGAGQTTNASQSVSLPAPPPAPVAVTISASPTSGTMPLTVSFTSSVSGGVPPYTYLWSFGDGATSPAANTVHIYVTGGNFLVWLSVGDSANGGAGSNPLYVNVTAAAVNLTVTLPSVFVATPTGIQAVFASAVTGGTSPYAYHWDFGDGSQSDQSNPVHIFANPGTYTVTVTVTDARGQTVTRVFSVTVPPQSPPETIPVLYLAVLLVAVVVAGLFGVLWARERWKNRGPPPSS